MMPYIIILEPCIAPFPPQTGVGWRGFKFDSTLGYPGEGPVPPPSFIICHNEHSLVDDQRRADFTNEFLRSNYKVALVQEHWLNRPSAERYKRTLKGLGIKAEFACRSDGARRQGAAILIKLAPLGLEWNDVSLATADSTPGALSLIHI